MAADRNMASRPGMAWFNRVMMSPRKITSSTSGAAATTAIKPNTPPEVMPAEASL